jgi:REP element-mobilizing transposase RayT
MNTNANHMRPGHAALRRGRYSSSGQTYLVTTTTLDRRPWLTPWPVAIAVAREIGGARLWRDNHVHAWVLMPNHMHVLVTLGASESLSHLMSRVKAVTTGAAHGVTASSQPFWARAFHDRALRRNEDVRRSARYVIANPMRAGLVHAIGDWPFWDCEWL